MQNSAVEMIRKSWRVGVMAQPFGLGSAHETRALRGRRILPSALLLHHQHEGANERDRKDEANALQRPDKISHQNIADPFYGERFDWRCWNCERFRFQNCPE